MKKNKSQQRNRSYKNNQIIIIKLKHIITNEKFAALAQQQSGDDRIESVNLRTKEQN